jgi:cell volume regulation protein A
MPLPRRLAASLEAESGLNDAPVILLVTVLAESLTGETTQPWWLLGLIIVAELAGGAVIGTGIGFAGAALLRRVALPVAGFYPLATLALCVLAYSTATLAHTSGFVAVYLCGVVLGNVPMPHRSASVGFAEGMASVRPARPARVPGAAA